MSREAAKGVMWLTAQSWLARAGGLVTIVILTHLLVTAIAMHSTSCPQWATLIPGICFWNRRGRHALATTRLVSL